MKNIYKTIGLTTILIILIKVVLPEPSKNRELIEKFWVEKTLSNSEYNIVITGDSRTYRGVDMDEFTNRLSPKFQAINMGYSGAGFSDEFLDFAVSKIDSTSDFKILILGISPRSLTKFAMKNGSFKSYVNSGSFKKFRYEYLGQGLQFFAPYKPSQVIKGGKENYIEVYKEKGWVASSYIKLDTNKANVNYRQIFMDHKIESEVLDGFYLKVEKIIQQGITVLAFRPPTTMAIRNIEDSIGGFDEKSLKTNLESLSVKWLELNPNEFQTYDGSHLEYQSASKIALKLTEALELLSKK